VSAPPEIQLPTIKTGTLIIARETYKMNQIVKNGFRQSENFS
jgi:hypothetical protein